MAECTSQTTIDLTADNYECAICLQTCVHPAQLPCGHIFCYLCIKGIANQSKKCAMCRQEIPRDFLIQPKLLEAPDTRSTAEGYQWFYEGRNGWWQYDERTSNELEVAYKSGERTCELLIAGFLYVADFDSMIQRRRNDPLRRRRIKRDLSTIPKKGVAGLRISDEEQPTQDLIECPGNCPTPPVTPAESTQVDNDAVTLESLQSTMQNLSLLSREEDEDNENLEEIVRYFRNN